MKCRYISNTPKFYCGEKKKNQVLLGGDLGFGFASLLLFYYFLLLIFNRLVDCPGIGQFPEVFQKPFDYLSLHEE